MYRGPSFLSVLFFMFLYLKLKHEVEWSWFCVLAPLVFQWVFVAFVLLGQECKRQVEKSG